MPKPSPTQRTLAYLRERGWTCAIVEKWNAHAQIRQDAFGCLDIIACRECTIGVQACAGASASARANKARDLPGLAAWLKAQNRFIVVAWRLVSRYRGGPKAWEPRCLEAISTCGDGIAPEFAEVEFDSVFS